jgi:prolyl 4-hydroxylase
MNLKKMCQLSGRTALLLLVCILNLSTPTNAELFTALVEMEELLETETVLMTNLNNYIGTLEDKLEFLKRKSDEYQREHSEAAKDVSLYLSNPVNAYLLTKRLTTDWKEVETVMTSTAGEEFLGNVTSYRDKLKFPTEEDLNGVAAALIRLQDTYKLDTASIARGELNGKQYHSEMTAADCFELGRLSYQKGDHYHTVLWMREALDRLSSEVNQTSSKSDILEYLAFSTFKQGIF